MLNIVTPFSALIEKGARPQQIIKWADDLLARMANDTTKPDDLAEIGNALAALAGRGARPDQINSGANTLFVHMTKMQNDQSTVGLLGKPLARLIEKGASPDNIENQIRMVHVWLRQNPGFNLGNEPEMASLLARVPLREILLSLRSVAAAKERVLPAYLKNREFGIAVMIGDSRVQNHNRNLLAAALSKHLKANKNLAYWDALKLAKQTDPKVFAEVASEH